MAPDPLLTPREVAEKLRLSRRQVYTLIREQELRALKLGHRTLRIKQSALTEYLEKTCS